MTVVAILPVETEAGTSYQAISGKRVALGETAGEALDALETNFPELGSESLLVVQRFQPDVFFSAEQQRRLGELMARWREARARGASLSSSEQSELELLVDAEVSASGRRAEAVSGTIR